MIFSHIIKSHEANGRLDHFLMKQSFAKEYVIESRSECTRMIRDGIVLVNGAPTKPSHVLKTGDTIVFQEIPQKRVASILPDDSVKIAVLFENNSFAIISKPAGIAMHPTAFDQKGTVANGLVVLYPSIASVGESMLRPGIVHRLDKNTSGICIIAKTQEAFVALKDMFKRRIIQKTYAAIVYGHIEPKEGVIIKPIARSLTLHKQVIVDNALKAKGKIRDAVTHYTVLQSLGDFDFVEAQPKTGRMHQIRVHFGSVGHPIVGDKLYGTKLTRKTDVLLAPIVTRHLLHAKRLEFELFGESYDFSSPLPQDFQGFLASVRSR